MFSVSACRHKHVPTFNIGVYEIVNRDGRKTSFAYKLEIPREPGEVQQELQIKKEASYTLSIKVPPYICPCACALMAWLLCIAFRHYI